MGAGTCVSVRRLLAASYKILVGHQDWGMMEVVDLDKGEYFVTWCGLELLVHYDNKRQIDF